MSRTLEVLTGLERQQWVEKARAGRDLALYPHATALRDGQRVTVVFEPDVIFVGEAEVVVRALHVACAGDPVAAAPAACVGRGLEGGGAPPAPELMLDSTARRAALAFIDAALGKHGNLGSDGDLSPGLARLSAAHEVVVYDEPRAYAVELRPRAPRGGEPRYDFRVRKRDGALDEVVVAAAVPPAAGPGAALGDGDDVKTGRELAHDDDVRTGQELAQDEDYETEQLPSPLDDD